MRIAQILKERSRPTVSFELFPARDDKASARLNKAIDKLAEMEPDFVSVTFGAGGSTRKGSYELAEKLKNEKGLEVLPYFACWGLGPDEIESVLSDYREIGLESVLAVRGDAPTDQERFTPHPQSMAHASDLLAFIKQRFDFCLGAAGYPEGHKEAQSLDKDIEYLKLKQTNGAEFIIANYFYDNRFFFDFFEQCRTAGIEIPIVPGVMPIFNVKMMENLAALCGATVTDEVRTAIAALPEGDKEALINFGIDLATRQCIELIERGAPGVHVYTMDRSKSAVEIVKRLRGR